MFQISESVCIERQMSLPLATNPSKIFLGYEHVKMVSPQLAVSVVSPETGDVLQRQQL